VWEKPERELGIDFDRRNLLEPRQAGDRMTHIKPEEGQREKTLQWGARGPEEKSATKPVQGWGN